MKNFIQRETMNYEGDDLAEYCRFLGKTFIDRYAQVEGVQVSAVEIPFQDAAPLSADGSTPAPRVAFQPAGPERAVARVELTRTALIEAGSGIRGFRLLRLGGSAFQGFVRDEYTTLPDIHNRPLHMWLDLEWRYRDPAAAFATGDVGRVRHIVRSVFTSFESGSIQQVIHQIGSRVLVEHPAIAEVQLEANNRTWDTIAERGDELGVYTDARPPYGCLGLRLTR
jgi:urate oxidase